jgi:hypothetical protein
MTFGNSKLIQCLCTINDYIIEEGLDLSTYADTLEKKKYPEDMVNDVRVSIANIRESLREIYPEPKPINPDEELQLSVDDAIEGINRYIENGGYKDVEYKLPPIIATERTVIDNYVPVIGLDKGMKKDDKDI